MSNIKIDNEQQRKVAFITGITGQDGSYLAEFLLKKGYIVHGMKRRSSLFNTERIDHLYQDPHEKNVRLHLHYGDMTDSMNITRLIKEIQPDEIYNLAAMSHVHVSFETPEYTANADGIGTLRILEAIRLLGLEKKTKVYQASTSELYGKVQEIPQSETTPFYPRSPYAVAKMYAYWITVNYREAYGIFASNGILFNHESVTKNSPLILKIDGKIDILPIEDLFRSEKHRYEGILKEFENQLVWNGTDWTKIIAGTCYQDKNKPMKLIQTRSSSYEATFEHVAFLNDNSEIKTEDIKVGDFIFACIYPEDINILNSDVNLAKFIGFVVGDGSISSQNGGIRLTGSDRELLIEIAELLTNKFGWNYNLYNSGSGNFEGSKKDIWQLDIQNDSHFGLWLNKEIYSKHSREKKVPQFILNSNAEIKKAFFDGYYLADGRQAGHEKYEYKGFTTKSQTLALGLIYIFKSFSNQVAKVKTDYRDDQRYYNVQFRSDDTSSNRGKHLLKELNEVIEIIETKSEDGWFFDIQTESETFATGSNLVKVHNSPVRGETFVTRKITRAVSKIALNLQDKLYLGNLDAKRDWGHARDYCIDLDSQILTTEGFKCRSEINIGDKIINFNSETNLWEYDTIEKIYDVEYDGDMYHFLGNGLDFRCSENHRLYYKRKTNQHKAWNDLTWQEGTAKEVYELFEDKELRTKYDFSFPGFTGLNETIESEFNISDDYISLIGYLVTEGHLSKSKEIGRGLTLSVSQSKKNFYADLKKVIDNLKLEYRESVRADEVVEFIFSSESRDQVLEYFDSFDIHELPRFIYKLSKRQLIILYTAMMNGDGCWSCMTYVSKRKSLIDDFMNIVSIIGYKSKLSQRASGIYDLHIMSSSRKSVNNFVTEVKKEHSSENIWCVETTNNKTIITKRNDTIFVSGNCTMMWLILQAPEAEDWVIATGQTTTVRDFVRMSFRYLGIELDFIGEGVSEKGLIKSCSNPDYQLEIGREVVAVDPRYFRPTEVDLLLGNPTKAETKLGWKREFDLQDLVNEMMASDLKLMQKDLYLQQGGYKILNRIE